MAIRTTRRVAHHDKTLCEQAEADDSLLAVISPLIFHFEGRSCEDVYGVFEVQAALRPCDFALGGVVGDSHEVNVATRTGLFKALFTRGVSGLV